MQLLSKNRRLDLQGRVGVVGILNLTPDSFYDGGELPDVSAVLGRARQYITDGADIVELGAESTNQHSKPLSASEELERLMPALVALRQAFPDIWISVDTYKADVAEDAIAAGADMINDVTAGRGDERMFSVVAESKSPIILMYSKDPSARTTVEPRVYENVVSTIHAFLEERCKRARVAGIVQENIIIDPGLGHFVSSKPEYSYTILDQLRDFTDLGPVLVSPSRKSFLAGPENDPPEKRLPATLSATLTAVRHGASFIRTHDVLETVALLQS